jgi:hypothetical protein
MANPPQDGIPDGILPHKTRIAANFSLGFA